MGEETGGFVSICQETGLSITFMKFSISMHCFFKKIPDRFLKTYTSRSHLPSELHTSIVHGPRDPNIPQTRQTTSSEGITFPQDNGARKDRREERVEVANATAFPASPALMGERPGWFLVGDRLQGRLGRRLGRKRLSHSNTFKAEHKDQWPLFLCGVGSGS